MASNLPYQPKFLNYRVRAVPNATEYQDNQNVDPSADMSGATYVTLVTNVVPPAPESFSFVNSYGSSATLGPVVLLTVNGFSDSALVTYLQFFFVAPNPGDTPDINAFRLSPGASFSWTPSYPLVGGDWEIRLSTTPNTYTPSADNVWIHAEISS